MCVCVCLTPTTCPTLWTPTRCCTIQISSDPHCHLELMQTSQVKGSVPQDWPHFRCQWQVQATRTSEWPTIKSWGNSHNPLLRFINSLEWLIERGKVLYLLLLVYSTGHNSGTARWKRWIWQGMGLQGRSRASMPSLDMSSSQHPDMFTNLEVPWSPWRFNCIDMIDHAHHQTQGPI